MEEIVKIDVIFVKDKEGDFKDDITAVFVNQNDWEGLPGRKNSRVCYQHVGQHSECTLEWVSLDTVAANEEEYNDLKVELVSLGYELNILPYSYFLKFKQDLAV